jgi:hypothetical protein
MSKHIGKFYFDHDIVRWNSNNNVPPEDCLKEMLHDAEISIASFIHSNKQRDIETDMFLADYRERMKDYVHSEEELYEMRSAFGEGATVVNIITGKTITL